VTHPPHEHLCPVEDDSLQPARDALERMLWVLSASKAKQKEVERLVNEIGYELDFIEATLKEVK